MADFTSRMVALLGAMRRERNGAVADAMRYYGADYGLNYGVSLPTVRTLARACGRDHEFARYLYAQEVRELRLAALHIAEPERLTADEFAFWGGGICNSEVAEEAAFALLGRIDAFDELFRSWCNGGTLLEGYAAVMAAARREDSLNHIDTAAAWLRRVACRPRRGDPLRSLRLTKRGEPAGGVPRDRFSGDLSCRRLRPRGGHRNVGRIAPQPFGPPFVRISVWRRFRHRFPAAQRPLRPGRAAGER